MIDQKDFQSNRVEIGLVREASFDPVVGESVVLALRVRSSSTQLAASNIEVIFTVGTTPWRVVTDDTGWASFTYKAENPGDVVVVATLDSVNDAPEAAPSHTFRFKALAAGVWNNALIELNNDGVKTVWGTETKFPRITQPHIVKLSLTKSNSDLIGYDVCLGLKGYSSASELGLTVEPALGVSRQLTSEGLSWKCTGTNGGAYALQLSASRLLEQSPVNAMSLGAFIPTTGLPAGIAYRVGEQLSEVNGAEIVARIPLGAPVVFSISVPSEMLNGTMSFELLGEWDISFSPVLDSPQQFSELTKKWTVQASRWGIDEYIFRLTYSSFPDSPQILKFLIE
jgi:hypothetical protein